MKKLIPISFLFALLLLFSCKKGPVDNEVLKEMSVLKTEKELKLTYKMLTHYEQAAVWKNHLNEYLKHDLSVEQEGMINELISKIEPSIFKTRDEKFIDYGKQWLLRASKIFTREEVRNMVVSLQSEKVKKQNIDKVSTQDCGCKRTNNVITLCGGVWNANEVCAQANCTETSEWCGFLLLERCNGQCTIEGPTNEG